MRISRYHRNRDQQKTAGVQFSANEFIRVPEIQLIDETGTYQGKMDTAKALSLAQERGYDLVEVNPTAQPPVCKLLNYGQFKYEKEKEMKRQKQALKQVEVKGVRLSTRIGQHDLDMRLAQAKKFLEEGNKIKVEIILRGRERQHVDLAFRMIHNFFNLLKQQLEVKMELTPSAQGGKIFTILTV